MDHREEEKQSPDQTILSTGSPDRVEEPTQGQEVDSGDEWDTDLETDIGTHQKQCWSGAELYLQACQSTGCVPVSSFLRHLGGADLDLSHYGVGPLGAKALAVVLQVGGNDLTITDLELEDNALQAEGTRHLMEMLQINMSIQSLVTILKLRIHIGSEKCAWSSSCPELQEEQLCLFD
uniref:Uncharacterized protein n=1 Tax=Cyclopterus lumpus TaxID=8103 RepID=A0A8C3AGV1_CYCLU